MPSLKVHVVSARGLGDGKTEVTSYCKVTVGKTSFKTKPVKKADSPNWDEVFVFPLNKAPAETDVLIIEVVSAKKKSLFGSVQLKLADMFIGETTLNRQIDAQNPNIQLNFILTCNDFGKEKPKEHIKPKSDLPPTEELDIQFKSLMSSLGIDASAQEGMAVMSNDAKWSLIKQHSEAELSAIRKVENTPASWAHKLRDQVSLKDIQQLRIILGGEPITWLSKFIELEGIALIINILDDYEKKRDKTPDEMTMVLECLLALRAIMNNKVGVNGVLNTDRALKTMALCLDFAPAFENKYRKMMLNVFTVACAARHDGHKLVMEAMSFFKLKKQEKKRFKTLVTELEAAPNGLKTSYMAFINALINSPTDIDLRVAVRTEFQKLGIQDIIAKLKETLTDDDTDLVQQIDIFEEEDGLDFRELHDRFAALNIDIGDIDDVFNTLRTRTKGSGLNSTLLAILQNLLLMPVEGNGVKSWLLAARIIRQISLHKAEISVDDDKPVNLDYLLTTVEVEAEVIPYLKKIEELEQRIKELDKKAQLQEIEIKEKEETIKELKARPPEVVYVKEQVFVTAPTDGTIPPPLDIPPPPPLDGAPPAPPLEGPPAPPPLVDGPPPPPLMDGPPGPPPIFGGPPPIGSSPLSRKKKRDYMVTPATKMKGLQWTKIDANKIKGTVFEKFGDSLQGVSIDISDIEVNFAAKAIKAPGKDDEATQQPAGPTAVLEAKVSQNLMIFLSQFKTTPHEEIAKAVKNLNDKVLTLSQIKQLLQFAPSKADITNIESFLSTVDNDISKVGVAEQFCLELNKVSHIQPRLQSFLFKIEFVPKKSDIKPNIELVLTACNELEQSEKLKKVFEVILAVGNVINGGTRRGEAYGFKLSSLRQLTDTRTTDNKKTLLQYVVEILINQSPQLLKFAEEVSHCGPASKVVASAVAADITNLRKEYANAERALDTIPHTVNDRFHEVMENFLHKAKEDIDTMTKELAKMEERYKKTCSLFCEDPKSMTPEEMFGIVHKFVSDFQDAVKKDEEEKQKKEKEAKRAAAKEKALLNKTNKSNSLLTSADQMDKESMFNNLLTSLQTGKQYQDRRKKFGLQ